MVRRVLSGHDGDVEQLSVDLKALAEEVQRGDVFVVEAEANHVVDSEDDEAVELEITIVPTTESRFSGGYNIPMEE